MTAVPGCRNCRALTTSPANVHPEHVHHTDAGHHHVQCPNPPCDHYPQETT